MKQIKRLLNIDIAEILNDKYKKKVTNIYNNNELLIKYRKNNLIKKKIFYKIEYEKVDNKNLYNILIYFYDAKNEIIDKNILLTFSNGCYFNGSNRIYSIQKMYSHIFNSMFFHYTKASIKQTGKFLFEFEDIYKIPRTKIISIVEHLKKAFELLTDYIYNKIKQGDKTLLDDNNTDYDSHVFFFLHSPDGAVSNFFKQNKIIKLDYNGIKHCYETAILIYKNEDIAYKNSKIEKIIKEQISHQNFLFPDDRYIPKYLKQDYFIEVLSKQIVENIYNKSKDFIFKHNNWDRIKSISSRAILSGKSYFNLFTNEDFDLELLDTITKYYPNANLFLSNYNHSINNESEIKNNIYEYYNNIFEQILAEKLNKKVFNIVKINPRNFSYKSYLRKNRMEFSFNFYDNFNNKPSDIFQKVISNEFIAMMIINNSNYFNLFKEIKTRDDKNKFKILFAFVKNTIRTIYYLEKSKEENNFLNLLCLFKNKFNNISKFIYNSNTNQVYELLKSYHMTFFELGRFLEKINNKVINNEVIIYTIENMFNSTKNALIYHDKLNKLYCLLDKKILFNSEILKIINEKIIPENGILINDYHIKQLTDVYELKKEGLEMHHCVGNGSYNFSNYNDGSKTRRSFIFSMCNNINNKDRSTVEIFVNISRQKKLTMYIRQNYAIYDTQPSDNNKTTAVLLLKALESTYLDNIEKYLTNTSQLNIEAKANNLYDKKDIIALYKSI